MADARWGEELDREASRDREEHFLREVLGGGAAGGQTPAAGGQNPAGQTPASSSTDPQPANTTPIDLTTEQPANTTVQPKKKRSASQNNVPKRCLDTVGEEGAVRL